MTTPPYTRQSVEAACEALGLKLADLQTKSADAVEGAIKSAYRRLMQFYHPDINKNPGSGKKAQAINNAYDLLLGRNKDKLKFWHGINLEFETPGNSIGSQDNDDPLGNPFLRGLIARILQERQEQQRITKDFIGSYLTFQHPSTIFRTGWLSDVFVEVALNHTVDTAKLSSTTLIDVAEAAKIIFQKQDQKCSESLRLHLLCTCISDFGKTQTIAPKLFELFSNQLRVNPAKIILDYAEILHDAMSMDLSSLNQDQQTVFLANIIEISEKLDVIMRDPNLQQSLQSWSVALSSNISAQLPSGAGSPGAVVATR